MTFHRFDALKLHPNYVPGWDVCFAHGQNVSLAFSEVQAGSELPSHSHPHEQVTVLLEGEFDLTVAGERNVVSAGSFTVIPPNATHSGRARTDCKILEIFSPVREDYPYGQ